MLLLLNSRLNLLKLFHARLGIEERLVEETLDQNRSRRKGGGRKAVLEKQPDINEILASVLLFLLRKL
jgi:hypothetical protein